MSAPRLVTDLVTKLELSQRPFRLTCDSGDVYLAETVILATGAQARWLGTPSEEKFKGFGVSACATCDGFFYRGKEVMVVGGGNTAVEEALFLTNFASQVTIVHRRDHFRAERILQDRLFKNPKIKVIWDSAIDEIRGTENPAKVTHVRLKNVKTGTLTEVAGRRRLHRDRPCARDRTGRRPAQAQTVRLCRGGAEFHRDLGARRVRRRRRRRRNLSASSHGRGPWLHGRPRGRTLSRAARERPRGGGVIMARTRDGFTDMDWDKLKVFHAAAEAGSFTHAGEQLGLSQSAVSRQVSALEQELSVSLFHRHARGLILTEQGDLLFRTAHDVFMQLQAARAKLTDSRERPSGDLKVDDAAGARHQLADSAAPRIHRALSGDPDLPDRHRRGTRSVDARGRRRDPHPQADPARFDPAQAVLDRHPCLLLAGIHQALRHAAHPRRPRRLIASSC